MEEDKLTLSLPFYSCTVLSPHKRTWLIGRGTGRGDHTLRSGLIGCGLRRVDSALS